MANRPAAWRQAVTWRLHRDLVAAVQAAAAERDEPVVVLVARALTRELDDLHCPPRSDVMDKKIRDVPALPKYLADRVRAREQAVGELPKLRTELEAAHARVAELETENERLRTELRPVEQEKR